MRFTAPTSIIVLLALGGLTLAQDSAHDSAPVGRDAPELDARKAVATSSSIKAQPTTSSIQAQPTTGPSSTAACKRAFEELSLNVRNPHGIFERASRCGQFCSISADCTDPACPLCAHSNGACEWQKSCRART